MNVFAKACVAAAAAGALATMVSVAFAQDSPGIPDGILTDQFHLQAHPQLEFAASAPTGKYQPDKKSAMRRRGDNGDPNGCNLQCPQSNNN